MTFNGLGLEHVLWLSLKILGALGLFASEALFPALEVVILALGAFPASIRELEVISLGTFLVLLPSQLEPILVGLTLI